MAQVRMSRYEAEEGMLPPVCVRCGAPATRYKRVSFSTLSDVFYLVVLFLLWPLAMAAVLLRQRALFLLPVCHPHRNHWRWRRAFLAACFVVLLAYLFVLFDAANNMLVDHTFAVRFLTWSAGPAWLAVVLLARIKMVRPNQISEESVRLTDVHPTFARAYRNEHAPADSVPPAMAS